VREEGDERTTARLECETSAARTHYPRELFVLMLSASATIAPPSGARWRTHTRDAICRPQHRRRGVRLHYLTAAKARPWFCLPRIHDRRLRCGDRSFRCLAGALPGDRLDRQGSATRPIPEDGLELRRPPRIHALARSWRREGAARRSHDIGCERRFAYAAVSQRPRSLVLMDALLPGVAGGRRCKTIPTTWHLFQGPTLSEWSDGARDRFRYFWNDSRADKRERSLPTR